MLYKCILGHQADHLIIKFCCHISVLTYASVLMMVVLESCIYDKLSYIYEKKQWQVDI